MRLKSLILRIRGPVEAAGSDRLQRILAQQKAEATHRPVARGSIQAAEPNYSDTIEPLYPMNVYDPSLD